MGLQSLVAEVLVTDRAFRPRAELTSIAMSSRFPTALVYVVLGTKALKST